MTQVTNNSNITLALAVWLLHTEYDHVSGDDYISATKLMRPLRQIILPSRLSSTETTDVEDYISRALGNSLHDSIEKAWLNGHKRSLSLLGYPDHIIDRVRINPTPQELAATPNAIPVYLEQRSIRQFGKYRIGGKFDMVAEGIVHDNKSTSAYTWLYGGRDEEHQLQGSIYRWLNPDKITEDFIRINYIFTDWKRADARSNPAYPQSRVQVKDIPLLSIAETEAWIATKIMLIERYKDSLESEIPECTDAELWRSAPQFKYYSDPTKTTGRSTKNFETLIDANSFMASKGGKGVVLTVPSEPKRCGYCEAFNACTQKDKFNL